MNDDLISLFLEYMLNGVAISGIGADLYVSLHTANPGPAGTQTTSEAAYTGYARVALPRSTGSWTVAGTTFSPAASITFPPATGGTETEIYGGLGTAATGSGTLLWSGPISPPLTVSYGVTPQLLTTSSATID